MRVSFPLTAEGGRIRVALAALCAMALLAFAAAATPPSAHAAFTLNACQGGPTKGEGSSLQATAQEQVWTLSVFYTSFGCGSGAVSTSPVSYKSDGSGCGIASIGGGPQTEEKCSTFQAGAAKAGERASETRFAASDAPLTPTEKANAEAAGGTNPGVLHQIPVAVAAVTVIVHFPEGCSLEDPTQVGGNGDTTTGGPNDPGGADGTGDKASPEDTLRVHIPASEMEKIWEGEAVTWGDVLTSGAKVHISGTDTSKLNEGVACENVPVRRIVRFDGSGTTYNFKAYLSLLPGAPSGLWTTAPVVGDNNNWPITAGGEKKQPETVDTESTTGKEVGVCEDAAHICTPTTGKGGPLAKAVAATDGSISYVDLATARKEKFSEEKGKVNNDYWIPLQTINPEKPEGERVGANYVEPTAVPTAHIVGNGATLGANCTNADYRGLPSTPASDPTLGDWSNAIATGSTDSSTYPACAITYDLAFDDDAPVYGNTPLEQERARTVKDYLTAVESPVGQSLVSGADYGVLPLSIQSIARAGVEAIGWDKAAGAGTGPKEEVKTPVTKTPPPPTTGVTPPPIPSNAFSIASAKVKGKTIVLSLVLPDAGSVQVKATGGGVTVGSESASVSGGKGTVTLAISKSALSKLAKAKGHKLSVKITVTFTPTGGTAATQTKTLTVTQAAVTPPKKKASKKGKKK
jgi:ABC-type phosphate transport system substrate-binding protein